MRVERIDETVKVRADFQGGGITPLLFRRGSQDYRVSTVNARWEDREGMQKLLYFSVTATNGAAVVNTLPMLALSFRMSMNGVLRETVGAGELC